jgi:azurin
MRKSLFIVGIAGILAVLSLACGGSSSEETQASTTGNTGPSSDAAQSAPPPSGDGFINISADGNRILFDTDTITTTPGKEVTLTLSSKAITNSHNWVLIQADANKNDVAAAGLKAGEENHFVVPGDPNVIASTAAILGGESTQVTFITPAADTYTFVCTVPGHDRQMYEKFIVSG